MTVYKLTYFNLRARAENARMLFALAGVQYEDNRVPFDKWPALKPTMMFNQLPVLDIDGHQYCQSKAIARYLAKKFGYAGETDMDQFRADIIVDAVEDLVMAVVKFLFEKDEARKTELQKNFVDDILPGKLSNFAKCLERNKDGSGYFVGKKLTWADIAFFNGIDFVSTAVPGDVLAKHPNLKALTKKVESEPKIAEWIAKRPASDR